MGSWKPHAPPFAATALFGALTFLPHSFFPAQVSGVSRATTAKKSEEKKKEVALCKRPSLAYAAPARTRTHAHPHEHTHNLQPRRTVRTSPKSKEKEEEDSLSASAPHLRVLHPRAMKPFRTRQRTGQYRAFQ